MKVVIVGADYEQIEMRIIGELSGEESMIQAALNEVSMHDLTCQLMYGPVPVGFSSWKEADPRRYKLSKVSGFASVYGGGAEVITEQTGEPLSVTRVVNKQFKEAYPEMTAYKRRMTNQVLADALTPKQLKFYQALQREFFDTEDPEKKEDLKLRMNALCSGRYGALYTMTGRRLLVDAQRAYSAVNYRVQSDAREVLVDAIFRLDESDVADTLLLPVHDEIIGEAPIEEAEYVARRYGELMSTWYGRVPLTAAGEIYGKSWGDKYKKEK